MDEQPRWNPQSKNEFYASDHRSMRQPVAGTVAFGRRPLLGNETGPAWQHTVAQERTDLMVEVMGMQGLGWEGEGFEPDELKTTRSWLWNRAVTIYGGSTEIQNNIISKRVLGMLDHQ